MPMPDQPEHVQGHSPPIWPIAQCHDIKYYFISCDSMAIDTIKILAIFLIIIIIYY